MRPRGFQWFVAWRYLMARPRRLSGIIILFAIVFASAGAAVGYSALLYPLTDEFIAAGEPIPPWLPIGFGAAVAMSMAVFLSATARLVRQIAWPTPEEMAARRGAHHLVANVPGRARALLHVAGLLAALLLRMSGGRAPFFIALGGVAAIAQVIVAAALLSDGNLMDRLPGLADQSPVWTSWLALVPAGAFAFVLAFGLTQPRGPRRSRIVRLATYLAAAIPVGLAHALWWRMADFGLVELSGAGIASDYHAPVWLTIVGGVAGAFFTLSLILLGIRYFFTFFTTVSMGGVAIGTMALVITLSVMSGFETDLRSKILGSNAHVLVTTNDEAPFPHYRELMERTARVRGVVAQTPYLTSEVVIAGSSNYFNVVVKGIDPETIARVTNLGQDLDDEEALRRMWPLSESGGVVGPPPDPPPSDLEVGEQAPTDWSGAGTEPPPPPPGDDQRDAPPDPAPADVDVDVAPPTDWSGGLTEAAPEAQPEAQPEQPAGKAPLSRDPIIIEDEGLLGALRDATEEPGEEPDGVARRLEDDEWLPSPARELDPHVAALPGVLVGRELQKQINLYEGQEVKVISPLGQNTIVGQTPYIKPYRVAGTFFTGMYEYDLKRVYVELGSLQDFLDLPDAVTGIEIRVREPDDTEPILEELRRMLGAGYTVQDWKELNRSLFSALKLEKIAMFLVLAIIILVASFSIVGNLIMVVVEKAREIAVLKTLGASDSGVTRIFIVQGFFIGLVGTAIGFSLGLTACLLGERYGISIPSEVYYIDRLPIHVEPVAVSLVAAAGVLISVAATIYPARIAARLRPVEGLRYE